MIELENSSATGEEGAKDVGQEARDFYERTLRSSVGASEDSGKPPRESHFNDTLGRFVLVFGLVLPALAISCATTMNITSFCGVLLRHWVETLIQFLFLIAIPFGLAYAWTKVKAGDLRRTRLVGHAIGVSCGSALLAAIVTSALAVKGNLNSGESGIHIGIAILLAFVSWSAFAASLSVGRKYRNWWPTKGARRSATVYMLLGAGISMLALTASEARSACIRIAEKLVIGGNQQQRTQGLNFLQALGDASELSLKIDCSTSRAMDVSGLFLNLKNEDYRKLYFLTTGQPFRLDLQSSSDFAALPDELLGTQVIGDKIANLAMHRSLISGTIHPESLTSTIDWTFVFKNTGTDAKEARTEIGLPKDAVISEMVLWINDVPKRATIASSEVAAQAYQTIVAGRRDPALVTDLGNGRVLVQCYPVPAQSEVRIKISMKSSMKLDKAGEAIVSLPSILKSNFEVEGEHRVNLRADRKLMLELDNVRQVVANNGLHLVTGTMKSGNRSKESIEVRVKRDNLLAPVAIKDPFDSRGFIVQQYVPTVAKKPDHLVVVVDGSQAVAAHKLEIIKELEKIPASIPTSLIVASKDYKEDLKFASLGEAIKEMKDIKFVGGQENLGAVIQGAELAGETEGGALLWIHGPQPALDKELYIIAPYLVKPSFFQLSIEDNVTDVNEMFRAHQEIGPFTSVARNSTFEKDLSRFLNKWQADGVDFTLKYARTYTTPALIDNSVYVQDEISRLFVAQKVRELVSQGRRGEASDLAIRYQIVTPVTSAVVLEKSSDYVRFGLQEAQSSDGSDSVLARTSGVDRSVGSLESTTSSDSFKDNVVASESYGSAPLLQGATSGTATPEATIIGVNTSGTVRVNNLANLEALLNIFANCTELFGLASGSVLLLLALVSGDGFIPGTTISVSRKQRVVLGAFLILAGLATPGFLNNLIASARDSNVFS